MSFSELKKYYLGDVIDLKSGKSRPKEIGRYRVYGGNGILGYSNKFNVSEETIIIGRVGAYCGSVYFEDKNIWISDNALYAKAKKGFNSKFLYYYLKDRNLNTMAGGSSHPLLTQGQLNLLEVELPEEIHQNSIATLLSSLDESIKTNEEINKTLEDMAKAIFKEWFVDFNFPNAIGKFQESEIGEIPIGWKVYELGDLIDTISETYRFGDKEKIIFLNTGDISEGEFLHRDYSEIHSLPGQAKKSIKRNDILFSEIRPANKRYAFVNFDSADYVVSTKLMVLRTKKINPLLIYFFLTREETLKELQHLAESRSGTFPQITFTQLKDLKIVLPTGETLDKFIAILEGYYSQSKQIIEENQTLINLRDTLLPKLMKGEIEINSKADVEEV